MLYSDYLMFLTIFYVIAYFSIGKSESFDFPGPKLRLLVISRSTPKIENYAQYSRAIISQYAQYNDYNVLIVGTSSNNLLRCVDYESYPKLCYILEALHQFWDYIVWIDADFIPLDFNLRFEVIAAQYPQADVLISADVSTMINTGCIVVKNSLWSRRFVQLWLDQQLQPNVINDQTGFDSLYQHRQHLLSSIENKLHILPSHVLNSVAPAMSRQEAHHQVLHLAAEDDDYRTAVFRHAYHQLQQVQQIDEIPHQLGLNRTMLQTIAMQVYGELSEQLHHILSIIVRNQIESNCSQLAKLLPRYRMVTSKACFTNVYHHNNQESLASLFHRLSSFQLLLDIIASAAFRRCSEIIAEGLKIAAELGYEYLGIMVENQILWQDDNEMIVQYREVIASTKQILQSLLTVVHATQRHIVEHMQRDFNQFLLRYHVHESRECRSDAGGQCSRL